MSVSAPLLWPPRADVLPLEPGDIHVWAASLLASPDDLPRLHAHLSPDEQQRAARMRLDRVRDRFIVSRGRQREILAAYLSVTPGELCFAYGDVGKPRLAEPVAGARLFFNLSNSHEIALLAIGLDCELGIDIEQVDRKTDHEAIARRFFAERETRALAATPAAERKAAFYRCWTRKEAVLKALGVGLTFPLDRVEVPITSDTSPGLLALDPQLGSPERWTLVNLVPAEKYAAALAFEGEAARVDCFSWLPRSA